ncbi:MATE family efflux transporter [Flavitalea sp. BT771]|uniref:MATE family efflux transporter n=1 Tax=Flavitalea sp. BT771 TaxID=3063329 RepID=UPI0026E431CE|nr:MATE family efflux transporter [Flavitalea sp. BT771]MDO6434673.1 MATE family efflux transporter [Flavitalea sp. BT771]MDV6223573.1 MATE family efflux transporter [Flavitalea sp. BT771]
MATKVNYKVSITTRDILRMALPISLAILVPQINFITNNIFLGHLDEHAESLSTAGITGVYYLLFAVIGQGLNNGLQALIARRAGEDRIGEIGKLFSQGMIIAMGLAFTGILLTWFLAPAVLSFSLRSQELRDQAVHFLRIRIWGLPFLYIYQMRNALLVGTNQSKYLVYGTLAETIVNITLDYALIYGHLGLPALGFNGAAYASIAAEAAGMLVVFLVINAKGVSKQLQLYKHWRFDAANTRLILVQSSPLVFQYSLSIMAWVFFYILIEHHGRQALAISNTMRNIFGLFGVFTWAFASTTNAMVSNIIGQKMEDRVIELIHKILRLSVGFAVIVALLLNIFPTAFLAVYGQDASFTAAAIPVIRVVSSALVMMSFATIWLNAVTGTANTRINLLIELITIVFYCCYVYLVLERWNMSILYGWMSEWVYWLSLFVFSYLYIRSGKWKGKII